MPSPNPQPPTTSIIHCPKGHPTKTRQLFYKLDNCHHVHPCNVTEASELFDNIEKRRVASTQIGKVIVSTVFLTFDHCFNENGPPLLFETMVFDNGDDARQECQRCSTWNQAVKQHRRVVASLQPTPRKDDNP